MGKGGQEEYSSERVKAEMDESYWNWQIYGGIAGLFGLLAIFYTYGSFSYGTYKSMNAIGFLGALWPILDT